MGKAIARDRLTWMMYLVLGYYAYLLNILGPVMPFLRGELDFSYTLSSFHFSAFATGMLLAGLGGDRFVKRFGRYTIFWFGALGMAMGAVAFILGHHPLLTIIAAFLMGAIGTTLLVIIPAVLADRHGEQRAVAITEANVIASMCSMLAPVIVGFSVGANLGWRVALVFPVLVAILFSIVFRRVALPAPASPVLDNQHLGPKLPVIFWVYWGVLILAVSVEFCIVFWGSTFLEIERGFVKANAASVISLFLGAMTLGRLMGSWLARRLKGLYLVLGSVGICSLGFLIHWLAMPPCLTVAGLVVLGLGVANLYPQTLALAVGVHPAQTDLASARASLASGAAILILPLILGGLADQIGIRYAYGMIFVLLFLAATGVMLTLRLQ